MGPTNLGTSFKQTALIPPCYFVLVESSPFFYLPPFFHLVKHLLNFLKHLLKIPVFKCRLWLIFIEYSFVFVLKINKVPPDKQHYIRNKPHHKNQFQVFLDNLSTPFELHGVQSFHNKLAIAD